MINFLAKGVMVSFVTFATMKSWHVVCEQTRVRMRRALDYLLNRHHAFKLNKNNVTFNAT